MSSSSQTSESFFPLTTFSPPPSCLQHISLSVAVTGDTTVQSMVQAFPYNQTECFPEHFQSMFTGSLQYYSPGECPVSYTTACTPDLPLSAWKDGEAGAQCCPRCEKY